MLHLFDHVYPLLLYYIYMYIVCIIVYPSEMYVTQPLKNYRNLPEGCPQVPAGPQETGQETGRALCQAWRSQPCNSTLTTAVTVPVCCRGLRHAK